MSELSTPSSPLNSPAESLFQPPVKRTRLSSSSSKITLVDLSTKGDPSLYLTVRHPPGGAFSPTPSAAASLQFLTMNTPRRRRHLPPPSSFFPPLPEPQRPALSIPSISRVTSFEDLPRTPTSRALLDFDHKTPHVPDKLRGDTGPFQFGTPPSLRSVERLSRLCTKGMSCATCSKTGTNFPACSRCGEAWCSRACRLPLGVRHVCSKPPLSLFPS